MPKRRPFSDPPIRIKGGSSLLRSGYFKVSSKLFLNTDQEGEHFTYERKVKVKRIVVIDSHGVKHELDVEDGEFEIKIWLEMRRR